VALLLLAFATSTWMVGAFALLNGLAWGARVPVVVSMRAEYFGSRSFGAIMGISSLVVTMGGVIAPIAAGLADDATGTYTVAFAILAVVSGLGCIFLVLLPPPQTSAQRRAPAA
ncbi:MAG: MFS transporter, partial [Dehalococcoidia bacterium]|nr:MFS transporter [Dehalococcoidia bacterium]